jgi:hypothetical protein
MHYKMSVHRLRFDNVALAQLCAIERRLSAPSLQQILARYPIGETRMIARAPDCCAAALPGVDHVKQMKATQIDGGRQTGRSAADD